MIDCRRSVFASIHGHKDKAQAGRLRPCVFGEMEHKFCICQFRSRTEEWSNQIRLRNAARTRSGTAIGAAVATREMCVCLCVAFCGAVEDFPHRYTARCWVGMVDSLRTLCNKCNRAAGGEVRFPCSVDAELGSGSRWNVACIALIKSRVTTEN